DDPCALDLRGTGTDLSLPASFSPWSPAEQSVDLKSGNDELDAALGVVLVHMARFFDVRPLFGFIVEDAGANAFATPYDQGGYPDGTVAFGRRLLGMQLAREHGDYAVMA